MRGIKITLKNGEISEIDPLITLTVFNNYHDYDFKGEDIESIELYESEEQS